MCKRLLIGLLRIMRLAGSKLKEASLHLPNAESDLLIFTTHWNESKKGGHYVMLRVFL